jgi:hypothetical protein
MEDAFAGHLGDLTPASAPGQGRSAVSSPGDASERQAESVARRVVAGAPVAAPTVPARERPDFSSVRLHTGPEASRAARSVSASAYTVGSHVVLGQALDASSTQGRTLLAHELAHVVQQGRNPSLGTAAVTVHRKCVHDGQGTGCWAGAGLGRVKLTDEATNKTFKYDIGDIVVDNMEKRFGGTWAARVTVAASAKSTEHGFADGLKVTAGASMAVEVLEVKARSLEYGGCDLADKEAEGYRVAINSMEKDFVAVSSSLAAQGGLRIPPRKKANDKQANMLLKAGATGTDPGRWRAWTFYNSLQNRLDTTFITPFSGLTATLNADGTPGTRYEAAPPWIIDCPTGKRGVKKRGTTQLVYYVSGKGGASYGCDKDCSDEEERRPRKEVQPQLDKGRSKSKDKRLVQEGEEGTQDEIRDPGQPGIPIKDPSDRPQTPVKDPDQPADQPGMQVEDEGVDAEDVTKILVAAAALSAAAVKAKSVLEKRALEAAYKRQMAALAKKAPLTAKRLMVNGVPLGSKQLAHRFEKEAPRLLAKDLEKLALKEGKQVAGKVAKRAAAKAAAKAAGKALAKAVPFLGVVLTASEALAMADHVSKGGTIELGLGGPEADLKGDTKIDTKGDKPSGGAAGGTLEDTKIDITVSGIPSLSGDTEIDAKNVTITGSVKGDGTPVTVSFTTKLENSTITIKHGGVMKGGKVALTEDVTIKDSHIEIDLPPGATAATPDKPVTIAGQKLKITKAAGTGGKPGEGKGDGGDQAAKEAAKDAEKKAEEERANEKLKGLSEGARSRLEAAGPGAKALVAAMMAPGTGKGVKVDDAAVDAILKVLKDNNVTDAELEQLKERIGGPATSLDDLVKRLDANIKEIRGKGGGQGEDTEGAPADKPADKPGDKAPEKPPEPPGGGAGDKAPADKADDTPPPKPVDPNDPKFKGLRPGELRAREPEDPARGTVLPGVAVWGRTATGEPFEATVKLQVLGGSRFKVTESTALRTPTGTAKAWFVGTTLVILGRKKGRKKK